MPIRDWFLVAGVLFLLGAGSALFLALDVPGNFARWREQQRQIRDLEKSNAELEAELRIRRERLRRFMEDPGEQERYLRERQKRVRPGEKVFVLPPERRQ